MKYVLSFLFASLAIGCTSSQKEAPTKTQDTKQPNIVLIFIRAKALLNTIVIQRLKLHNVFLTDMEIFR